MINAKLLMDYFGKNCPLHSIDTDALDAYAAHLADLGNSNATINRKMACLSKILTIAVDRGKLSAKPKFTRKPESEHRIRWVTDAEEKEALKLFKAWGRDDYADAFIVLIDTGMRCGELLRIVWRDVDTKQGLIAIWQNKAKRPRSVPLTNRAIEALKRRREAVGVASPLFPYDHWWIRYTWDRMRAHLGLTADKQFTPHALRHTCASRLIQRGITLPVVQAWLGHKTIQITMRYAHLAPKNLLDAVSVLES